MAFTRSLSVWPVSVRCIPLLTLQFSDCVSLPWHFLTSLHCRRASYCVLMIWVHSRLKGSPSGLNIQSLNSSCTHYWSSSIFLFHTRLFSWDTDTTVHSGRWHHLVSVSPFLRLPSCASSSIVHIVNGSSSSNLQLSSKQGCFPFTSGGGFSVTLVNRRVPRTTPKDALDPIAIIV